MTPLVSALVLNFRSPKEAVLSVQSLLEHAIADSIEVIVIENHSEDDSIGVLRNRLKDFPQVRIVESSRNIGFGRGNNLGAGFARGKYILIINPDNRLDADALAKMTAEMERDPSIGILSPRLEHEDGTLRPSARRFPSPLDVFAKRTIVGRLLPERVQKYLRLDANPEEPADVDWVVGTCLLIRRDVFKRLGGFDPEFFLFFEDIDLCRRCRNSGHRIRYFPLSTARDSKRRMSEGGAIRLLARRVGRAHIASAMRYFWKWRHG